MVKRYTTFQTSDLGTPEDGQGTLVAYEDYLLLQTALKEALEVAQEMAIDAGYDIATVERIAELRKKYLDTLRGHHETS